MICLTVAETTGSPLYLDIHHMEKRMRAGRSLHALSATFGDGSYEGEVLLEVSDRVEVTLADEWLDPARLSDLFSRIGRDEVLRLLSDAAVGLIRPAEEEIPRKGERMAEDRQRHLQQMELPLRVAEGALRWHQAA